EKGKESVGTVHSAVQRGLGRIEVEEIRICPETSLRGRGSGKTPALQLLDLQDSIVDWQEPVPEGRPSSCSCRSARVQRDRQARRLLRAALRQQLLHAPSGAGRGGSRCRTHGRDKSQ